MTPPKPLPPGQWGRTLDRRTRKVRAPTHYVIDEGRGWRSLCGGRAVVEPGEGLADRCSQCLKCLEAKQGTRVRPWAPSRIKLPPGKLAGITDVSPERIRWMLTFRVDGDMELGRTVSGVDLKLAKVKVRKWVQEIYPDAKVRFVRGRRLR